MLNIAVNDENNFIQESKTNFNIAKVLDIDDSGNAISILYQNKKYLVSRKSENVLTLKTGDEVLVFIQNKQAYILNKLVDNKTPQKIAFNKINQDTLQLNFGDAKIEIKSSGKLSISNQQAHIAIDNQGQINIKTQENIKLSANKRIDLN